MNEVHFRVPTPDIPYAAKVTTDPAIIRTWAESRDGRPGRARDTKSLHIDFPGERDSWKIQKISWEEFFREFQASQMEFLYQEQTPDGAPSRYNRFLYREPVPLAA